MINLICLFLLIFNFSDDTLPNKSSDTDVKLSLFLPNPHITTKTDSISFIADADTVFRVNEAWTSDSDFIWLHYKDHGNSNFWADYYHYKHGEWLGNVKSVEPFIEEYFNDKKITANYIIIYSPYSLASKTHPFIFNKCGGCYRGIDYLFKIKKSDFIKIDDQIQNQFRFLKINYR